MPRRIIRIRWDHLLGEACVREKFKKTIRRSETGLCYEPSTVLRKDHELTFTALGGDIEQRKLISSGFELGPLRGADIKTQTMTRLEKGNQGFQETEMEGTSLRNY